MIDESRIQQFEKMAEADPENELGHFSLGKAYLDAGRFDDAVASLSRVLQLNPTYSKAYSLMGSAQMKAGDRDAAVTTLKKGFRVAHDRGDLMPRDEMARLLTELGETTPAVEETKTPPAAGAAGAGPSASGFGCARCGSSGPQLGERPFKGELGEEVLARVCEPCWKEWVAMGTKVINELRLDFADPRAEMIYDQHMKEFLNL